MAIVIINVFIVWKRIDIFVFYFLPVPSLLALYDLSRTNQNSVPRFLKPQLVDRIDLEQPIKD